MFDNEDKEAILRYIFDNDKVEMALGVVAVQVAIRERIIREFLRQLKAELRLRFKDSESAWLVGPDKIDQLHEKYWLIYLTKKTYKTHYSISLQPQKDGPKEFIFGVVHNLDGSPEGLNDARIQEALKGKVPTGKSTSWWPYYRYWEHGDWTDLTTLCALWGESGKRAASTLADDMLKIAQETEEVIDDLVSALEGRDETGG